MRKKTTIRPSFQKQRIGQLEKHLTSRIIKSLQVITSIENSERQEQMYVFHKYSTVSQKEKQKIDKLVASFRPKAIYKTLPLFLRGNILVEISFQLFATHLYLNSISTANTKDISATSKTTRFTCFSFTQIIPSFELKE